MEREPELLHSTCSHDSWARGSHQKVVAFSFYGSTNSTEHQKKKYWSGIEENLALVEALYGEGWSMRVYHDLLSSSPLHQQLCSLACSSTFLDLCPVAELPSSSPSNASSIFPMVWRFLPTLDPQVPPPPFEPQEPQLTPRWISISAETLTPGSQSGRLLPSKNGWQPMLL